MPTGYACTDEQRAQLIQIVEDLKANPVAGSKWKAVSDRAKKAGIDISGEGARQLYSRLKRASQPKAKQDDFPYRAAQVMFADKKHPKDLSLTEMLKGFTDAQEFRANFNIGQIKADVKIESKKPVALS